MLHILRSKNDCGKSENWIYSICHLCDANDGHIWHIEDAISCVHIYFYNKLCLFYFQESCYGVFKGAVDIDGVFTFARVQKSQDLREEESSLGCALHRFTTAYEYIPAKDIKTPCPFIHDCFKGKCRVSFSLTKQRVEQQNMSKRKLIVIHNVHHKIYMLNKFHL